MEVSGTNRKQFSVGPAVRVGTM